MEEQVLAVQRMQDYIEEHLSEEITIGSLAGAAGYSPWHSRRLFEQFTGCTPAEYVRKLRLGKSALKLRDEKCRIIDAAMEMGFESVDGYQRAFYREFGCNPKEYAKNPVPVCLFTPYGVKSIYMKRSKEPMENTRTIFITVIEKPERKVIIKRGKTATDYWAYCEEVGCDVWGMLKSIRSLAGEPVCLWLPERYRKPDTSEYVQGVEVTVDDATPTPEGFDVITLPAAKYLMFQGEPFAEENYGRAIEEICEAEKKYDPAVIGYAWDDSNPRIQLEPIGTRGYIELLPVKEL